MVSLGTPLENGMKPSPLLELNPNMLVRDVERMFSMHVFYLYAMIPVPHPLRSSQQETLLARPAHYIVNRLETC